MEAKQIDKKVQVEPIITQGEKSNKDFLISKSLEWGQEMSEEKSSMNYYFISKEKSCLK
jgi:hypothetical protein